MRIRPSIGAPWYPNDPALLKRTVDEYLAAAPPAGIDPEAIKGLIVPHAGHQYSGGVAAHAYAALGGGRQPETIAIIGPLHHPHPKPLLTSAYEAYQTPLGEVPIDVAAVEHLDQALRGALGHGLAAIRESSEHSIEVQLPFLQRILGEFAFVPVMLAEQSRRIVRALAAALNAAFADRTLLVLASSDLSHHYPQKQAELLDREMLRRVERLDPEAVLKAEDEGIGFACGKGAIAAALWTLAADDSAHRHLRARVLRYATSGDVTGEIRSVVGYAAVCLYDGNGEA